MSIALSSSSSFFSLSLLARLVPVDSVLKLSILIVQKLALHQNGLEFRQQFNGAVRISLTVRIFQIAKSEGPPGNSWGFCSYHCHLPDLIHQPQLMETYIRWSFLDIFLDFEKLLRLLIQRFKIFHLWQFSEWKGSRIYGNKGYLWWLGLTKQKKVQKVPKFSHI